MYNKAMALRGVVSAPHPFGGAAWLGRLGHAVAMAGAFDWRMGHPGAV